MASYGRIRDKCDAHNRKERDVQEQSRYPIGTFWKDANRGAFLISDGVQEDRDEALLEKIITCIDDANLPTVIINTSESFEEGLILACAKLTQEQKRGLKLCVSSVNYPSYQVFYGMNHNALVDYLFEVSTEHPEGYRTYIYAFLRILERCGDPTLTEILKLSRFDDHKIREIGTNVGVEQNYLDNIIGYSHCGAVFRDQIQDLADIFQVITERDCDSENSLLKTELTNKTIFLITLKADNLLVLNRYFATVLRQLRSRGAYRLILNGLPLQEEDGLKKLMSDLYDLPGMQIGLSMQDVLSVYPERHQIARIPTQVIFSGTGKRGSTPSVLLEYLGQYPHKEPVEGGNQEGLFELIPNSSWSEGAPVQRDRIRQKDIGDKELILKGSRGTTVVLVKKFT